jgi:serine/threonine protein kinase
MSLIDHPNVLRAHGSFTAGYSLWVVMPYMAGGSCLHIMKSAFPEGFEEPVIATLLRETLKALVYIHEHGHIHRDVKVSVLQLCILAFPNFFHLLFLMFVVISQFLSSLNVPYEYQFSWNILNN